MRLSLNRLDEVDPGWFDRDLEAELSLLALSVGSEEGIDLVLVNDRFIRWLNREFRGKDSVTDVISFSYVEDRALTSEEMEVGGEVYVSIDTIEKEAKKLGVEAKKLFLRAVAHGLLHVAGFDHEEDSEAERMEAEEKRILGKLLDQPAMEKLFGRAV